MLLHSIGGTGRVHSFSFGGTVRGLLARPGSGAYRFRSNTFMHYAPRTPFICLCTLYHKSLRPIVHSDSALFACATCFSAVSLISFCLRRLSAATSSPQRLYPGAGRCASRRPVSIAQGCRSFVTLAFSVYSRLRVGWRISASLFAGIATQAWRIRWHLATGVPPRAPIHQKGRTKADVRLLIVSCTQKRRRAVVGIQCALKVYPVFEIRHTHLVSCRHSSPIVIV